MKKMKKYFIIFYCFLLFLAKPIYSQTLSGTIEFYVNTDTIVENENYYKYFNEILPKIKEDRDRIDNIILIGSASPEGNKARNLQLANSRAQKIYSQFLEVPREKIIINNDYSLFLEKTGYNQKTSKYSKLRATYIEVSFLPPKPQIDTVFVSDTVYIDKNEGIIEEECGEPIISIYNDLISDWLLRTNLGAEVYFNKMSFFIEGSFSRADDFFGRNYNIDIWHLGLRKYFNEDYNKLFFEAFGNVGYFDTDLFTDIGKIGIVYGGGLGVGYVFSLCSHWKIVPIIRFGIYERLYYSDYYYSDQGNIVVSFGNYQNGKVNSGNNTPGSNQAIQKVYTSKAITKEFIENSSIVHYSGPTYIGITIKRDFHIKRKTRKKL